MLTRTDEPPFETRRFGSVPRLLWNAIRLPILGTLLLLEPIVRVVCSLAMILGIFVSVMFEISAAGPRFPFLGISGNSSIMGMPQSEMEF